MESYLELTFIHNLFIHSFSLTLSNIYSKKRISKKRFIVIILCTTLLQSFLFIPFSSTIIWINEIVIFFLFKYLLSTYFYYVGFRLIFVILYYLLFDGTIYHNQYFIFDNSTLYFDCLLFVLYLSVLYKLKYIILEKEFIYPFVLNHNKYVGFMDSGNQATYNYIPIIFIKENIYNKLNSSIEMIDIETVSGMNTIEVIKSVIEINSNKIEVYCSKLDNDFKYDALLNMKGIL